MKWTRADDKLFEEGLVLFPEEDPDRWEKIATRLPNKSIEAIKQHYGDLVYDVNEIDSGRVELPKYSDDMSCVNGDSDSTQSNQISSVGNNLSNGRGSGKGKTIDVERKKGTPWTEEEHRLFLVGLERYGKGDWRSISRNVVMSRIPTQVASHAQKYYLRQNAGKKERKRSSIHDITTVDEKSMADPAKQSWIPPPNNNSPLQKPTTASQLAAAAQYFGGANSEAGREGSSRCQRYNHAI